MGVEDEERGDTERVFCLCQRETRKFFFFVGEKRSWFEQPNSYTSLNHRKNNKLFDQKKKKNN